MDSSSVFFAPDKGPIGPFMQPPDQGSRVLPLFLARNATDSVSVPSRLAEGSELEHTR